MQMLAAVRSYFPFPLASRAAAEEPRDYSLVDLGEDENGTPFLPVALNDAGDLCLASHVGEGNLIRGTLLRGAAREPVGEAISHAPATCLSSSGLVAGTSGRTVSEWRAWAAHLGTFGAKHWPSAGSHAQGINARGDIVGNVMFDGGEFLLSRAFVRSAAGSVRLLTPPHGGTAFATAINDAGDIAVNSTPLGASRDDSRAWLLREQCYIAIQGLGGRRAWASAITPCGRVVGRALTADGTVRAFLWDDGATIDLGTLGVGESEALGANDELAVAGRVTMSDGRRRAFLWRPGDILRALDELVDAPRGWQLHEAVAINGAGTIVGSGLCRGKRRGFLLKRTSAS